MGNASIQSNDWTDSTLISFTGVEPLSILNAIDVNISGALNVRSNTFTIDSQGFTTLDQTTTVTGGTITAPNGLVLSTGQTIVARGAINAPIYSQPGSTITATGNLALGDATAFDGIDLHDRLNIGVNTVTLNDGYKVVLGSQTTLDTASANGFLVSPNGIALEDNQTLTGRGTVTTVGGTFENQGHVQGQSSKNKIRFSQLVTSRGSFANVQFDGGSSLGNSLTLTEMQGTNAFGTTNVHTVELGGLLAGNEYDKIVSTGSVNLAGTLNVQTINLNNGFVPTIATDRKVADLVVTDDEFGTNTLSLSGADVNNFKIVGNALYLKAGACSPIGGCRIV